MSLNKIETADIEFEVSDGIYDIIIDLLKRKSNVIHYQHKPPTVEISLEDAKQIKETIMLWQDTFGFSVGLLPAATNLSKAISKAEGKEPLKSMENGGIDVVFDKEPVNTLALPIQDQVNELRKELSELKHTISRLQSVIEGMRPNLNAVRG